MKKILIILMISIFTLSSVLADNTVNIDIVTDDNITATIITEGNEINTDIFCIGTSCNYELYNGEVFVEHGQNTTVNNNNYYDKYVKTGNSFSMKDLVNDMTENFIGYITGELSSNNKMNTFFLVLDEIFVSHNENFWTINNVEYLSNKVDELEAKNKLLIEHLEIKFIEERLECETGINKAKRTGQRIETENGLIIDIELYGKQCIKLLSIE